MTHEVRIQSDGHGSSTVITDASGREIPGITEAKIVLQPNEPVQIELDIKKCKVDVNGTVTTVWFQCPCCNELISHECS